MKHLVVDITAHGFGHAGMTLPVLDALVRDSNIAVTIRSRLSREWLAERMKVPFNHMSPPDPEEDFGMLMENAMHVRQAASLDAYQRLHQTLEHRIGAAAHSLEALRPDLLISNIPYISLAAAARTGIRAVAYSTLNWADIFASYCGGMEGAQPLWQQMAHAYNQSLLFLQPTPFMPMPAIRNGLPIGPVARLGIDRREELRCRLGLKDGALAILVGLGGLPMPIRYQNWPEFGQHRVILGSNDEPGRPDIVGQQAIGMPFVDIIRSCDAIVVKSGYGTIVEAACNGCPTIHVVREGWPETNALTQWLVKQGHEVQITERALWQGHFLDKALAARARPLPPPPSPTGIAEAAAILARHLA